ncbi:MAG: DUF2510 domain-containing protein [Acidimicrobiia bacterium]|nr:DUF2510 domain-containing protein [Acidimicrobiia bacterium]
MTTPAGWYQDPSGDGQRYWDGESWTEHVAPITVAAASTDASTSAVDDGVAADGAAFVAPLATEPAAAGSRSPAKLIGGLAAAAVVAVAGFFAYSQLASASGGADSPEEAVSNLMSALSDEDLVGMSEVLLPGERRTFVDPALEGLGHLQRWGILDEGLDTSDVAGLDLEVEELDTRAEAVTDDIVNVYASATVSASIDGESLPVGDLVKDLALDDQDMSELDTEAESEEFSDMRITTVEEDGRWYVSMLYTTAEAARMEMDAAPIAAEDGLAAIGADSPGEVVDGMVDAIADMDLEGVIARLNPDEAQALQRYAPLFIGEAQAEIDEAVAEAGVELEVTDVEYDIVERDGIAIVQFRGIALNGVVDGEEFAFEFAEGCISATVEGETEEECLPEVEVDLSESPIGDIGEIFSDMDELGLVVAERDGQWYVSPIRTYSDIILTVMRAIDRDELERFINAIEDGSFAEWIETLIDESFENTFAFSEDMVDDAVGGSGFEITEQDDPDPELADLRDACGDGDMEACDDLYWSTSVGSDDEEYGSTCGGTSEETNGGCTDLDADSPTTTAPPTDPGGSNSGDDAELGAMRDACGGGDMTACDDLYWATPVGSVDEEFGSTCGGTTEPTRGGCAGG